MYNNPFWHKEWILNASDNFLILVREKKAPTWGSFLLSVCVMLFAYEFTKKSNSTLHIANAAWLSHQWKIYFLICDHFYACWRSLAFKTMSWYEYAFADWEVDVVSQEPQEDWNWHLALVWAVWSERDGPRRQSRVHQYYGNHVELKDRSQLQ